MVSESRTRRGHGGARRGRAEPDRTKRRGTEVDERDAVDVDERDDLEADERDADEVDELDDGDPEPEDPDEASDDEPYDDRDLADDGRGTRGRSGRATAGRRRGRTARPLPANLAARAALRHLAELTGKPVSAVISLDRTERGWRVGVEVVEDARIPSSADILAVYQTDLDDAGDLRGYRRTRRYSRGRGDSGVG